MIVNSGIARAVAAEVCGLSLQYELVHGIFHLCGNQEPSDEPGAPLVRNSVSVRVILDYEPVQRQRKERLYTVTPTGAFYIRKFQNPKALRNPK